jgi:hypothetical protein
MNVKAWILTLKDDGIAHQSVQPESACLNRSRSFVCHKVLP